MNKEENTNLARREKIARKKKVPYINPKAKSESLTAQRKIT